MSLFTKTIHITANPPPRTLADSKLILSALQKFGEVVTFRNLKYEVTNTTPRPESHTLIAIYEATSAASAAIAASPLHIPLPVPVSAPSRETGFGTKPQQQGGIQQIHPREQEPHQSPPPPPKYYTPLPLAQSSTKSPPPGAAATAGSTMQCTLTASRTNHTAAIRKNPWHAGFEIERQSHPYMYEDLVKAGIPLAELADGPARRKGVVAHGRRQKVERETEKWGAGSLMGMYRGRAARTGGTGV
ncbi:uncharacterized protein BP01DRAFT_392162 [Aspergillus saccharolyticus JOP 1030-1]|uniref:Uncharacterized protein n=1 Tax=Aspergillus saccharolyticus JOP 1030-1 TaxID=1450539 RepID=A0A318ZLX6_9EURO|nr:hypothetical protein BP01DRAFT_392162 [Aspergillus saccharolyticus JOP 1030-1]PYH44820.1 hypothetical protein BP01DRAFT_392162 [Aspergillus saccharolyticus JOP 1030-1]